MEAGGRRRRTIVPGTEQCMERPRRMLSLGTVRCTATCVSSVAGLVRRSTGCTAVKSWDRLRMT